MKAQAEGISSPTNPELPAVWTYPKPSREASHELHLPWPAGVKSQELENRRDLPSKHLSKYSERSSSPKGRQRKAFS